jgi:hypothetical protein
MNWLPNEMQPSKQSKNSKACSSAILSLAYLRTLGPANGCSSGFSTNPISHWALAPVLGLGNQENWQLGASEHRTIVRTPQACQNPPGGVCCCGIVRCRRSPWIIKKNRKSPLRRKSLPVLLRHAVRVCRTSTHGKLTCVADEPSLEVMYRIDFPVASK